MPPEYMPFPDELMEEYNPADDSLEYEFIHNQELVEGELGEKRIEPLPSEDFPGTWNAAFNETKKAAKEVGKASQSFMGAIANSGISKAGYMLGSAVAKTATKSALVVAGLAVQATGTREDQLPALLREGLQNKKLLDEAKRRAQLRIEEAKGARGQEAKAGLLASGVQALSGRLFSFTSAAETSTQQNSGHHRRKSSDGFLLVGAEPGGYLPGSRYDGIEYLEEVKAFSDEEDSDAE